MNIWLEFNHRKNIYLYILIKNYFMTFIHEKYLMSYYKIIIQKI